MMPGFLQQGKDFWSWIASLPARARDLSKTNFDLALRFLEEGKVGDAQFRLRVALRFRPDMYEAWYHLGNCLLGEEKQEEALAAFRRALKLKPDYEEARFMLALLDPVLPAHLQPHTFPVSLVIRQFTAIAAEYDERQRQVKYCAPASLYEILASLLPADADWQILDVGCGTGWMGEKLRPHAQRLVGLDITPAMVEEALTRYTDVEERLYDSIITEDLRDYMLRLNTPLYELITAANVVGYAGGLHAVFDGAAKALKSGGLLAFTADSWQGDDYGLDAQRERFAHSETYIRAQAATSGLEIVSIAPCALSEKESGLACLLRKS